MSAFQWRITLDSMMKHFLKSSQDLKSLECQRKFILPPNGSTYWNKNSTNLVNVVSTLLVSTLLTLAVSQVARAGLMAPLRGAQASSKLVSTCDCDW